MLAPLEDLFGAGERVAARLRRGQGLRRTVARRIARRQQRRHGLARKRRPGAVERGVDFGARSGSAPARRDAAATCCRTAALISS